jgi:hypothetical protein
MSVHNSLIQKLHKNICLQIKKAPSSKKPSEVLSSQIECIDGLYDKFQVQILMEDNDSTRVGDRLSKKVIFITITIHNFKFLFGTAS